MSSSSDNPWFATPDALLAEMQRSELAFNHTLVIPGYDDAREHGRGGQGVIYTATQRSTNRRVAIKVLYDSPVGVATRRRRFEREIDVVSHLQHPHIVRVYDSGVTADDRLYVVMEYIEGRTLGGDEPPSGPAPDGAPLTVPVTTPRGIEDTLELFIKICDAVSYSHQHGVIHRDLKPGNILIDERGEPHVLDFGVAKATAPEDGQVTHSDHFMGTLAYAAPEQVDGPPAGVDTRSDVYALGLILYEMLTGQLPYAVDGSMGEAIAAITTAPIAPPSRHVPVDDEIDTLVLTALDRDPERRYQSAAALRDDCRRYLDDEPLDARRDSGWYMARKFIARHRSSVTVVALFVLMLAGFAAGMTTAWQRARTEANKFAAINEFLEDTLYALDHDPQDPITLRELLDASEPWMDSTLDGRPEVEAAVRTTIGKSYLSIGQLDRAQAHIERGLEIRRGVLEDGHPDIAKSLATLAQLHQAEGRLDEAETLHLEALDIRERAHGRMHADVAYSLGNLALLARERGASDEALTLFERQLAIREGLYGQRHVNVALVHFNIAETLMATGQFDAAVASYRTALEQRRQLLAEDHPDVQRTAAALAEAQRQARDIE